MVQPMQFRRTAFCNYVRTPDAKKGYASNLCCIMPASVAERSAEQELLTIMGGRAPLTADLHD